MRLSKISMAGLRSKYPVRDYRGEPVPDALPGYKPFIWAEIEQAARPSKVPWEEFKLQQLAYADWWFGSARNAAECRRSYEAEVRQPPQMLWNVEEPLSYRDKGVPWSDCTLSYGYEHVLALECLEREPSFVRTVRLALLSFSDEENTKAVGSCATVEDDDPCQRGDEKKRHATFKRRRCDRPRKRGQGRH